MNNNNQKGKGESSNYYPANEEMKAPFQRESSLHHQRFNPDSSNKKYMQNFLNQNLSQSEMNNQSMIQQNENPKQSRFSADVSPIVPASAVDYHDPSTIQLLKKQMANDPRKNDNNYVCLMIKKVEFFCSKENLVKYSNYLNRVFEKQAYAYSNEERNSQIKIKLPDSTKADILIMFIDYVDKGKEFPNKIDLYIAQNVVLIAEALKMRHLQKKFLMEIIMPLLNRENVIFYIKMSYNKLSSGKMDEQQLLQDDLESQTSHQDEEEFWFEFFSYSLDLAAANIQYLIKRKQNELFEYLEPSIIEEMIERAIRFYRADIQYDNTQLFDTLMKVRNCDSIFQLLEQERVKIVDNERQIMEQDGGVRATLTWKIQNLSGNFYRESDPFMVENAQWKLSISYFRMEEEALNVSIKMINNPFEVKKSKDYFKKKDFFLASNIGMQNQVNPLEELEREDGMNEDELQKRLKQIEAANAEYPSHAFITIVSSVRIKDDEPLKDPVVHTLICSAKSPALLKKFQNFRIEDYGGQVTVEIYFKVKYIFSAILLYISRNFTHLITDPYIYMLNKEQFKLILKHKHLNVTQEDEVVKAVCLWAEGQDLRESLDQDLVEILENVNWNYVTLPCFLDLMRNFPIIRRNSSFQKIVTKEFGMRQKFNSETTNLDPPRFSYKYNKAQSQNNQSLSKNQKNAKALLYVNHENFMQNLIESMLEPVDMIRAHTSNEGVNESSHRKWLELQLILKKREVGQIEEQLNNMRLMDELDHQSRANSRVQFQNAVPNNRPSSRSYYNPKDRQSRQGHNTSMDEVETVKNSMINLLNVMDGSNQKGENTQGGNHLRHISQEVAQQMHAQSNHQYYQTEQPVASDMYTDIEGLAKKNRIQILFRDEVSEIQNDQSQRNQEAADGDDNEEDDNEEQDEEDEEQEEEKEELKETSKIQMNNQKISINKDDVNTNKILYQSSQVSNIEVGGQNLVGKNQHFGNENDIAVGTDHKEIQTSLANIPLYSQPNNDILNNQEFIQKINQSIQMTLQDSYREQQPILEQAQQVKPTFQDQAIMCEGLISNHSQSSISNDIERDDKTLIYDHKDIKVVNQQQQYCKTTINQTDMNDEVGTTKEYTIQTNNNQALMNRDGLSIDTSNGIAAGQRHNKSQQIQQFAVNNMSKQDKIKFQQQMNEYNLYVEQMSKDIFDQNFLERFINSPTSEQQQLIFNMTGGVGGNNGSILVGKPTSGFHTANNSFFNQNSQTPNRIQVNNAISNRNINISISHNGHGTSTQPYTPASKNLNMSGVANVQGGVGNGMMGFNSTQNLASFNSTSNQPLKNIKSPKFSNQQFNQSVLQQSQQKTTASKNRVSTNKSYDQRAKSVVNINSKINQKAFNQRKIGKQSILLGGQNENSSGSALRQINKSLNNSVTRNVKQPYNVHQMNSEQQKNLNSQVQQINVVPSVGSHSHHKSAHNIRLNPNGKVILSQLLNESNNQIPNSSDDVNSQLAQWTNNTQGDLEKLKLGTPLANDDGIMQNFEITAHLANFNILDQLKNVYSTGGGNQSQQQTQQQMFNSSQPSYQSQLNNIYLDLNRIRGNELGTIEESKRSERMLDSDSYYAATQQNPQRNEQLMQQQSNQYFSYRRNDNNVNTVNNNTTGQIQNLSYQN